jgi:hypothetical protein
VDCFVHLVIPFTVQAEYYAKYLNHKSGILKLDNSRSPLMVVDRNGALLLPVGYGSKFVVSSLGSEYGMCRRHQQCQFLGVSSVTRKRGQIVDEREGAYGIDN